MVPFAFGPLNVREADRACLTTKLVALAAVPAVVVTVIGPVLAPAVTVAVICVGESTVKEADGVPLNLTAVAPVKFVPEMTTPTPTRPLAGVNDVIVAEVTTKLVALVAVAAGVVTVIVPELAPTGTVAVISVEELTVNETAEVPLNLTAVAPVKFVPVIATALPIAPLPGLNEVMVGAFVAISRLQPPEMEPESPELSS
jgi:hypothetical protein